MIRIVFLKLVFGFVFLFAKADIVILDPASVEIFYLLNAQDRIAATTILQRGVRPYEETSKLPNVGTFTKPSLERIVSLKPSLVILSRYSTGIKDDLERVHIKTLLLRANTLQDIINNINAIAKITGKEQEAKQLVDSFNADLRSIQEYPIKQRGVFFYSSAPLMAFGKDTLPGDILATLGVENIAHESIGDRPILGQEYILKSNPQFILYGLGLQDKQDLYKTNPLLKNTDAFKNENILSVNSALLLRGSPHIIKEIKALHEQLRNINMKEKQ